MDSVLEVRPVVAAERLRGVSPIPRRPRRRVLDGVALARLQCTPPFARRRRERARAVFFCSRRRLGRAVVRMRALRDAYRAALAVDGVGRVLLGRWRILRHSERPLSALLAVIVFPDSDVFEYFDGIVITWTVLGHDIACCLGGCEGLVVLCVLWCLEKPRRRLDPL